VHIGGHLFGLFGASRFALVSAAQDPGSLAMFLFAAVFMNTAATIPTGALRRVGRAGAGLFADGSYGAGWNGVAGVVGNRVAAEVESVGIDSMEMGSEAYPPG
jgi:hypothetical protein